MRNKIKGVRKKALIEMKKIEEQRSQSGDLEREIQRVKEIVQRSLVGNWEVMEEKIEILLGE